MSEYKHGSYITIDTDNLDFVNKTEDLDFIKEKIQNSLK